MKKKIKSQSQRIHTLVCTYEFLNYRGGGSTVAHKMSGGAHEKPCTHIPYFKTYFLKKKSRTQTPVKKSQIVFKWRRVHFPAMAHLAPYSTEHHQTQLCITSVCLHPLFILSNYPMYVCTEVLLQGLTYGRLGPKFRLSPLRHYGPLGQKPQVRILGSLVRNMSQTTRADPTGCQTRSVKPFGGEGIP